MGLTYDGLVANQQMFRLHTPKNCQGIVHKAYFLQFPSFFFLSDPPTFSKLLEMFCQQKQPFVGKMFIYM